jgi:predicted enzyme related to lactoylglutathione lyase
VSKEVPGAEAYVVKEVNMENKIWINWFEIPVNDFDRAKEFYEAILEIEIQKAIDMENFKMGVFPRKDIGGGAICYGQWYKPSEDGVLIYLDANPNLNAVLNRVEKAGGKILQLKKLISPQHGHMALFKDSEGKRVALRSKD